MQRNQKGKCKITRKAKIIRRKWSRKRGEKKKLFNDIFLKKNVKFSFSVYTLYSGGCDLIESIHNYFRHPRVKSVKNKRNANGFTLWHYFVKGKKIE